MPFQILNAASGDILQSVPEMSNADVSAARGKFA
jgi:hypothetical protein